MSETMTREQYQAHLAGEQKTLPGAVSRVSHSNLGKSFEQEISNTNAEYLHKGLAFVVQNEKTWTSCSHRERKFLIDKNVRAVTALTDTGYPLISKKSKPDFDGVLAGGRAVSFDCKETAAASFPLSNAEGHQVAYLGHAEKLGGLAGLLIHFSKPGRVFFVPASFVEKMFADIRAGIKTAKSISIAIAETSGVEIEKRRNFIDWIKAGEKF